MCGRGTHGSKRGLNVQSPVAGDEHVGLVQKIKHSLDFFFFGGIGPRGLVPPPRLECNSTLPLVTAVLITPKGVQPPGSRRTGVIGALVLILPSRTV